VFTVARSTHRRPGAALVEFALVFPLFLVLLFALVEIGRGMMAVSLLTNAARSGCRLGILASSDNQDVESVVAQRIKDAGLPPASVTITVNGAKQDVATAAENDDIKITVSVSFADVTWLPFMKWLDGRLTGQYALPHE
jgi:Flp pilus assembly protein TadG